MAPSSPPIPGGGKEWDYRAVPPPVTCAVPPAVGRARELDRAGLRRMGVVRAGSGPAEREVQRLALRCGAVLRVVVTAGASLLALIAAPTGSLVLDLGVAAAVNAWSAGSFLLMSRGARTPLLAADCAVVAAACLTQSWTVPPEILHGTMSWVFWLASIAVATWQWHSGARTGLAATAIVIVAYLIGSGVVSVGVMFVALWFAIASVLSRALHRLLTRAAGAADRVTADVERARLAAAVAAARRADERAQLAALHDTAATTLLAIGTGAVTGREPWLAGQIAADLDTLTGAAAPRGEVDLVRLLDDVARGVPVQVESSGRGALRIPAVPAVAICRSAREALVNVARHAGVTTASVGVEGADGRVVVEVADAGRGFDAERIPAHRRGIEMSIVERMITVGGRATVHTAPGRGTRVRLEWPSG